MEEGEVGMGDAVEEGGFDEGVMRHVIEEKGVADLEGTREVIAADGVAGETAGPAEEVGVVAAVGGELIVFFGEGDGGLLG